MRKIKFRAWDKMTVEMISHEALCGMVHSSVSLAYRNFTNWTDKKCGITVMQFTGFLDKNGKEVYEGDVLDGGDTRYSVTWNSKQACFLITGRPKGFSHYQTIVYDTQVARTEIIGNIYENPELLEVSK